MKKKLLVVCQHYWPETFRITDILDYFSENKDIEIDVLCGIPNYPSGFFFEGYGWFKNRKQKRNDINIRRVLEIKRKNNSNLRIFLNYISFPFFSLFHIPLLLPKKYDAVFLYQLSPVLMTISGIVISKIKKIPSTMYVLDLWPENLFSVINIKNRFLRSIAFKISHWHYKNVTNIISISNSMRDIMKKITNIPDDRNIYIPQVAEKIYSKKVLDNEHLVNKFSKTFNMVFTGNISPAQSFETVIFAAKKLYYHDNIMDLKWIIVGDGMSAEWLKNEVKINGLEKMFAFEGSQPIEKIPNYTNIADGLFGCLTPNSLEDYTIPAKFFSYMAAGRPLLIGISGESSDIVKDAKCGFTSNSGDNDGFYNAVKKLYRSTKEERNIMGKNAKIYSEKHFNREKNYDKMYDLIFKKLEDPN